MVRVAVTGGAGFIGSHVAIHLARLGYRVVAVDSLERATGLERLEEAGVPLVRADLRHEDLPDADVVVHAAAYIDVAESWEKPYEYMWNNAAVTAKVAKRAAERGAHLIYISSAAVYGEPEYLPIDERHPTRPKSPYGLSKLAGEHIAEMLTKRLTVARLFNVYGPGQTGPYAGVITKFIQRVKEGKPPVIFGDGEQTRDFIYVEDVARFVATAVEKGATGVYNVGTGKAVSIRELARIVMRLASVKGQPEHAPPRPGDIRHSVADITHAKTTGWTPQITLEEGIKKTLATWSPK
ncbi:NAD-dependent epimerase/dehydratase family protein [Pyrobaculum ferrireducens]|uniref:NAD-dependent epimerase/dehydratase n=1 Tax=Pyrobaculum ferrireducens TaxID=1104324 RepID=G7VIG6_9CREN|nr:NAD-dependent epimerase/dehydratase family protein [Pyrobaculum ferrireducens]AET33446.1 NAD-dependent epimerase/dehydratase [Pyrobaculum ferrireducens]